jgi:hypothetical protein
VAGFWFRGPPPFVVTIEFRGGRLGHQLRSSATRPAWVILILVTSTALPPANMRSAVAVANAAGHHLAGAARLLGGWPHDLAKEIIAAAKAGETNPQALTADALLHLSRRKLTRTAPD